MGCRDVVRCAMGSLGAAILGCSATLGVVTTLGDGVYLGGNGVTDIFVGTRNFLVVGRRVVCFLIAEVVGDEMDGAGGGMGVLGIHLVNSSRSLNIAVNCSW